LKLIIIIQFLNCIFTFYIFGMAFNSPFILINNDLALLSDTDAGVESVGEPDVAEPVGVPQND
jgi:hypothetical protein